MAAPERILFVEDVPTDAELAAAELRRAGLDFESRRVETREAFLAALASFRPTLILSDYSMPAFDGMSALALTLEQAPATPFVLLTGSNNEETAVACMKAGAWDYVLKDRMSRLPMAVSSALALARTREQERLGHEALRRSEAMLRSFLEASADAVFVKDAELRTILTNRANAALLGRKAEDLLGKDDFAVMPEAMARACRASDLQALRKDRPVVTEEEAVGRTFETRKFPVPLADGSVGVGAFVRDVTERKAAEDAVRRSEATARALLDAMSDPAFLTDASGSILAVNEAVARVFGMPPEALLGGDCFALLEPTLAVERRALFDQVVASREPAYLTSFWNERWYDSCIFPVIGPDGSVIAAAFHGHDITGRVDAERESRESNELLTRFLANSPIYAFIKEVEPGSSRVLRASENYVEMIGIPASEMTGRTMEELFPAEFAAKITADDWNVVAGGAILRLDEDLGARHYTTIKFPIAIGNRHLLAGYTIDITERKRTELALRESEERFRLLFETSLDGVLSMAPDGRILTANPAACRILGRSEDEINAGGRQLVVDQTDPRVASAIEERARTGRFQGELDLVRPDGSRVRCEVSSALYTDGAGQLRSSMIIRDIGERMRSEAIRRRDEARFRSLSTLLQFRGSSTQAFLDLALAEAVALTGSTIGYIYFYDEARRQFILNSWSRDVMKECSVAEPQTCYELDSTGIWGEAVRQRRPIILNDFQAAHPLKRGYPEGHVELRRYMTAPIFSGERIVAVIGVANKAADYDTSDLDQLRLLMDAVWKVVEQRTAQDALRASEARFQMLADVSPVGIFQTDASGSTVYVNRRWSEISGMSGEQALGDGWLRAVHPDDRERVAAGWSGATGASRSSEADYRFLRPDGSIAWVVGNAVAATAADGTVTGYVGTITDVTRQRQAEEALRESEARYRGLFENLPIGVYRTTPAGEVLMANPALLAMLGYASLDELRERSLEAAGFDPEHSRARFKEALERDGNISGSEARWLRKDGGVLVVLESAQAIRGPEGDVRYYEGAVEDVTERTLAEDARRRLSAAVDQAAEAVVVTDATGRIEYVNPAFERITGFSREEAVGRTPSILKSGRHDRTFYRELWATITAGTPWVGHFVNRHKDGTLYEEEATISPVRDKKGAICNFVAVKRDVTREVALQQQLNHAQKIEAVGRLAGGIAHDFNNLLQAILSQLAVLHLRLRGVPGADRPVVEVEQLVRRGSDLTRQLLLFARREASAREPVDLNGVIESAATLLRRVVRENVAIATELDSDDLVVLADRGQLDQVLMNLAVNASDAMPEGGRLVLRTVGEDDHAHLYVTDSGHGIAPEVFRHLFEPFFTTKGIGKGTGLGLSVVHGIVTSHGGTIEVASPPGEGATFHIALPRLRSEEFATASDPGAVEELPAGRGERVLLVEDEDGARQGLLEVLGALGYSVRAAASGEEAGVLPDSPPFDVLITDFMLPGISGTELASGLRERWPHLKVIMMSGYPEEDMAVAGTPSAPTGFLQKPFNVAALARTIRRVLDAPGGPPRR